MAQRHGGNNRNKNYNNPRQPKDKLPIDSIKEWIATGIDSKTDAFAYKFGKELVEDRLTKTQIRNVFSEVKRLEMKTRSSTLEDSVNDQNDSNYTDFVLLRSKFAYAVKRAEGNNRDKFRRYRDVIWAAQETVLEADKQSKEFNERFKRFAQFFEAILAYHKVHGGRD